MIGVEQAIIPKPKVETPCLSMRPREAALAMGISERLLAKWTSRGLVPHVRIGRVILYPTDTLREWLQKQAKADEKKSEEGA